MYFPIIPKEALTFALGLMHPGLKVTLVEASQEDGETKRGLTGRGNPFGGQARKTNY